MEIKNRKAKILAEESKGKMEAKHDKKCKISLKEMRNYYGNGLGRVKNIGNSAYNIRFAIRNLKNVKAAGVDSITSEIVNNGDEYFFI